MKSYQEGQEHAWDLADPAHQLSPAFLYNQQMVEPEGDDWLLLNTTFDFIFALVAEQGCATLAAMPYDDEDDQTWPNAEAYLQAIPYRSESHDYLGDGETPDLFDAVKAIVSSGGILSSGDLVAVGIPIFRPDASTPGRFDNLSPDDCEYDGPTPEDTFLAGYHALTIVGYDESRFGGQGGYKVANSWGTPWGCDGFAWLSEGFLATYGFDFYRMTDRTDYQPTGLVRFKISHDYWWYDNIMVSIGVGPTDAPLWSKALHRRLRRDALTMDRWADVTEGAAHLPPDWSNQWWLKVEDHGRGDPATIYTFEIECPQCAEDANAELVLPLVTSSLRTCTIHIRIPTGPGASTTYYVNDGSTEGDKWCTAPGDDANDGLTPDTPKATVQAIIADYTLRAGDSVYIDAGVYELDASIYLNYLDRGVKGDPIRFVGAMAPNREPATEIIGGGDCFSFYGGGFVCLQDLWLRNASYGIYCYDYAWTRGTWDQPVLCLDNVRLSGMSGFACYLNEENKEILLRNCLIYGFGGSAGIYAKMSTVSLENTTVIAEGEQKCVAGINAEDDPHFESSAGVSLRNAILQARDGYCFHLYGYADMVSSDYNDLHVAGTGNIGFALWGGARSRHSNSGSRPRGMTLTASPGCPASPTRQGATITSSRWEGASIRRGGFRQKIRQPGLRTGSTVPASMGAIPNRAWMTNHSPMAVA
jgi:hypothetical protein